MPTPKPSKTIKIQVKLDLALLMDTDINVNYELDVDTNEKETFLEATITLPKKVEDTENGKTSFFYVASFRCGRKLKNSSEEVQLISAEYGCFLKAETNDLDCTSEAIRITSQSIWPRFTSLAGIIAQQMMIRLPQFPITIDENAFAVLSEPVKISE